MRGMPAKPVSGVNVLTAKRRKGDETIRLLNANKTYFFKRSREVIVPKGLKVIELVEAETAQELAGTPGPEKVGGLCKHVQLPTKLILALNVNHILQQGKATQALCKVQCVNFISCTKDQQVYLFPWIKWCEHILKFAEDPQIIIKMMHHWIHNKH